MLITISPAKTLDMEPADAGLEHTKPRMLKQSKELISYLAELSELDISELMKVSSKIASLNFDRYQAWKTPFTVRNAKQCVLAFRGDVYTGLDADTLNKNDLKRAQKQLRILSGLYGVLRPMDLMQAYRLEMGTRLETDKGKNLYEFWGSSITEQLNRDLKEEKTDTLINLASNEYFKAVKQKEFNGRIITPVFKELRGDTFKVVGIHAKKARGLMTRYIIKNRLKDPEDIKAFTEAGYMFSPAMSSENEWVFTRAEQA